MRPLDYDSNEENNVDVNVQVDKPVNNTTEDSDMLNTEANEELVKQLVELQQLEEEQEDETQDDSSEPQLELESDENLLVDSDDIQLPQEVDSVEENIVESADLIEENTNDLTDELENVVDEESGMNWQKILLICGGVYLVYYLYNKYMESSNDLEGCILMEVTSDGIGLEEINLNDLSATSSVNTE